MKNVCVKDLKVGDECKIASVDLESKNLENQLKNLGFLKGQKLKVIKNNYGKKSYLVKVMGISYVVDEKIASGILVEYE